MGNIMHNTQDAAHNDSARLVQLLAALDNRRISSESHGCFADRLGRLFDLPSTIALDGTRKHSPPGPFASDTDAGERLQQQLADTRQQLLETLSASFAGKVPSQDLRLPLPEVNDDQPLPQRPAFKPYKAFYLAQQRQQTTALQQLRVRIRRVLDKQSPDLARLAELDRVFDQTLAGYSRQCFQTLLTVLEKRFRSLWRHHQKALPEDTQQDPPASWSRPGGWLHQFCREMQLMLLAELEVRQEPVQGLLDALQAPAAH